jgi:hypothetical protein
MKEKNLNEDWRAMDGFSPLLEAKASLYLNNREEIIMKTIQRYALMLITDAREHRRVHR